MLRIPMLLLLASLLSTGCSHVDGDDAAPALLGTLERHRADVSAPVAERLLRLDVREGQHVRAGQPLGQLDTRAVDARIAAANARIDAAAAQLAELVHGPRVESVLESRARLAAAEARWEREEVELRRLRTLLDRKLVSHTVVDDAQLRRDGANQSVREARAQLQALLTGTRIEQLDRARAELESARAERERAQVDREQLQLLAPANARVEALPYRPGERPPAGAPIVQLLLDEAPFARVYVPAELRANAVPGAVAQVSVDGQAPLRGTLRFVASEASFTPYFALTQRDRGHLVYLAEVALPASVALPAGLPVEVRLAPATGTNGGAAGAPR